MRGVVTDTNPGDSVEVWFEDGGERSDSFAYRALSETGRRVFVVAVEDYSGVSPPQTPGPHYLQYYLGALQANGVTPDVSDVDARGRVAPDHVGVLSHYDAVIWYTGDDVVTRPLGQGAGNVDRLAVDEILEFRAYMNEGGRLVYAGAWAGQQYVRAGAVGQQFYHPKGVGPCNPRPAGFDPRRCLALAGSPRSDGINDVLEYWLGAYALAAADGHDPETGEHFGVTGIDDPFVVLSWLFGPDGADNQNMSASFVSTSGILSRTEFPQFNSWPSSSYAVMGRVLEHLLD